jgi:hypothetical protein
MYKNKYFKYKNKYLNLKKNNQVGGNDINSLFNIDMDLLRKTNFFSNLHNYKQNIRQIGIPSSNGFINQLTYEDDRKQYSIVLKSILNIKSENLVNEYLVGQCINHFANFYPCFSKTFQICKYNSEKDYTLFKESIEEIILPKNFNEYFTILDTSNLEELVKNSCIFYNLICIFTQYIPIWKNLNDYMKDPSVNLYILMIILHLLYSCLSTFANYFTHSDFNGFNVVLVKIPKDQYVTINIHLIDGRVISYKTNIIPVIIDYGGSFINFDINPSLPTSQKIFEILCKFDKRNSEPICPDKCGDKRGFRNNFINSSFRRNISRDLLLLSYIEINIKLEKDNFDYINSQFKLLIKDKIIPMNLDENLNPATDKIYNVNSAFHIFTEIIDNFNFKEGNEAIFQSSTLYKTIDIWHGRFDRSFTIS